ncbi:MAG: murein biosynthesis integral membrane protein MurJ [Planctomycetes bacterium]|nr:murein biosynthesis integral membrane protein MurJ [Planctomycetota bacterium]
MLPSIRVLASARLIASLTLCSRVLGLAREAVFGYFFSTSELLSAYRVAYMIPNLARRLFGEGALSSALVPTLTDSLAERGEQASRRFVGSVFTVLAAILVVLVLLGEGVIFFWRRISDDLSLELAAILLPYMFLICIVAVAGGVLNVRGKFAVPAAAPVILNVVIITVIGGSTFLGVRDELDLIRVLCVSILVAGVIQVGVMAAALRQASFLPLFGGAWRDPQVRSAIRLMAPMMIGLSAVQINTLADYLIAYLFVHENGVRVGPAVLGYANNLYQLPLGVFGISLATVIFPVLSQKAAAGDRPGLGDTAARGIRFGLFAALPAAAGLILVARPLVAALLQHGEFNARDTERVAGVLVMYSIGLPAYFVQHVVVRTFYALRESRTPARVALWMVGINLALNLALVFPLQERGLALATAMCAIFQVTWLSFKIRRLVPELDWRSVMLGGSKALLATAVMTGALLAVGSSSQFERLVGDRASIELGVLVVVGVLTYGLAARVMRMEELRIILRR